MHIVVLRILGRYNINGIEISDSISNKDSDLDRIYSEYFRSYISDFRSEVSMGKEKEGTVEIETVEKEPEEKEKDVEETVEMEATEKSVEKEEDKEAIDSKDAEPLSKIREDMMLPSVMAEEPTKIEFGHGIQIKEVDRYEATFTKIDTMDKGKAPLVEEIKGNPAKERFTLISGDIEFLVQIRDAVIEEIVSFFNSFSIRGLAALNKKYREMLIHKFLEARRINFESGTPTFAIDLQVLDSLSDAHRLALIKFLMEKLRQHKLEWTRTSSSNLFGGDVDQSRGIHGQFYPNFTSTSWVRSLIFYDGSWQVVQGAYQKPVRLAMPSTSIQRKQLPQTPFVDAFAPIYVVQFSLFGHLQPVGSTYNTCRDIVVIDTVLSSKTVITGIFDAIQHDPFRFELKVIGDLDPFRFELKVIGDLDPFRFELKVIGDLDPFRFELKVIGDLDPFRFELKVIGDLDPFRFELKVIGDLDPFRFELKVIGDLDPFRFELKVIGDLDPFRFELKVIGDLDPFRFELKVIGDLDPFRFELKVIGDLDPFRFELKVIGDLDPFRFELKVIGDLDPFRFELKVIGDLDPFRFELKVIGDLDPFRFELKVIGDLDPFRFELKVIGDLDPFRFELKVIGDLDPFRFELKVIGDLDPFRFELKVIGDLDPFDPIDPLSPAAASEFQKMASWHAFAAVAEAGMVSSSVPLLECPSASALT
ncbi:zinc knuckle family protein [Dorcoceras hygrometricum]|uniref:Zinc knuckle family protein n=1 Tax=Dorcoceras hygrometricum TaxID=472368 RepID=A0A2Z7B063_9LAMI|nr:zinc knuckle family protein [Dorcoceras hygrometricum]